LTFYRSHLFFVWFSSRKVFRIMQALDSVIL